MLASNCYVAEDSNFLILELLIPLGPPPEFWGDRYVPSCMAYAVLETELGTSGTLGKYSPHQATALALKFSFSSLCCAGFPMTLGDWQEAGTIS